VSGLAPARIVLGGGFTRAAVFPQAMAGVLGRPIDVARDAEASGRGALIAAARAAGFDGEGLVSPVDAVEPAAADLETYERQYQRWRRLGAALDRVRQEMP
jgi:sugar (pentulose or hexulose) kinase